MVEDRALVCAFVLHGTGGAREIGWPEIGSWHTDEGVLWVHLEHGEPATAQWLREESGLEPFVCNALLADETWPRAVSVGDGLLVILRGVNLNPHADPEDMVSIRMWLDGRRVISVRLRPLLAIEDICGNLRSGVGPRDPGSFLETVAELLVARMDPVLADIHDRVAALEHDVLEDSRVQTRTRIADLRRQVIQLRRYLAPERDVILRLVSESMWWLSDNDRTRLREVADRVTRYLEELDAARDRAAVTQEQLSMQIAEKINKTMYILSLVATMFLPLGFVTGLWGSTWATCPVPSGPGDSRSFVRFSR